MRRFLEMLTWSVEINFWSVRRFSIIMGSYEESLRQSRSSRESKIIKTASERWFRKFQASAEYLTQTDSNDCKFRGVRIFQRRVRGGKSKKSINCFGRIHSLPIFAASSFRSLSASSSVMMFAKPKFLGLSHLAELTADITFTESRESSVSLCSSACASCCLSSVVSLCHSLS